MVVFFSFVLIICTNQMIICSLFRITKSRENMNDISIHVPPGFRFYPTDEELVDYYLRRKVNSRRIDLDFIKEVDLYKIEPWDLQEICRIGNQEQNEWYFFSHKDKKYPTGTRTNRATVAGFWKATGRDKAICSKHDLIGMRKTLVFYKGRAPNGQRSDWIMHEYRLETNENGPPQASPSINSVLPTHLYGSSMWNSWIFYALQAVTPIILSTSSNSISKFPQEEGWVVCRMFKKKTTTMRMNAREHESPSWFEDQVCFNPDMNSSKQGTSQSNNLHNFPLYNHKNELLDHQHHIPFCIPQEQHLIHLPFLENSILVLHSPHGVNNCNNALVPCGVDINQGGCTMPQFHDDSHQNAPMGLIVSNIDANLDGDQVTDWRVLDRFVASQLSQEVVDDKGNNTNKDYSSSIVAPETFVTQLPEHSSKEDKLKA
ncbi:hypothetical protein Cgig2_005753 [Carnegiea gigantea]|uniref:NAC domain-containing protein n=1 Tax=Carnegiea gigantea TaxID=171969 RepID=A0A9Q1QI95_9CARY|nr:hypothetical protein Cgig2_005753 [Carnegiea gigantea]